MSDCFNHEGDAADDYWFGRTFDEGYSNYEPRPTAKTCKFCGMTMLFWHTINGKWKLCKNGKPHDCKPSQLREK